MKYRSTIAFVAGVLAGVLLWPDDSDSPDSGKLSGKDPKIPASDGQPVPAGQTQRNNRPLAKSTFRDSGEISQYGTRPAESGYGRNDWENSWGYSYAPRQGDLTNWGENFSDTPSMGSFPIHGPDYDNPMYSNRQDRTGYRFRPLNGESDSDQKRRYTGYYQASPRAFNENVVPRWNETPTYGRPQPGRRYSPRLENRHPNYQSRPGELYSAR